MKWFKKKWVTTVLMLFLLAIFVIYLTPLREYCFFSEISRGSSPIEICVLSLTALIALIVYRSSCDVEEANMLLKIRELLSSPINRIIYDKSCNLYEQHGNDASQSLDNKIMGFHPATIYNYMGILESCETLLANDIISEENFRSQFGYRIECLIGNENVVKELLEDPSNWDIFFSLLDRFPEIKRVYNQTKIKLNKE